MNWDICSGCNQQMKGSIYAYDVGCGVTLDYNDHRFPLPLKCVECGINDWDHNHVTRWRVVYCINEECKDQQDYWFKDWKRKYDYSRIPLPEHGLDGPFNHRAYEIVFGTDRDRELVRMGRTLKLKEIDKRLKKVKRILKKYKNDYTGICEAVKC